MLIELAQEVGLHPKRTSSTKGGEFHSPCPGCGGDDRFAIWHKTGRYWCRQCKKSGDAIQFCRDFMGMSFQEACLKVGGKPFGQPVQQIQQRQTEVVIALPSKSWEDRGRHFIKCCHQRLMVDPKALELVNARGISLETAKKYYIGWNPIALFPKREDWGLEKKIEDGKEKKLLVPPGIVIPTFQEESLRKIKIRRSDWKEGDKFKKYHILPGSLDCIPVFGDLSRKIVVVVEAEFDAMLVVQEVGNLCGCIALGGAQKRPKSYLHQWLQQKERIIFALDFDKGGNTEYAYWHSTYENLLAWPVPQGKSPAEAWKLGIDLAKDWIVPGLQRASANYSLEWAKSPSIRENELDGLWKGDC